MPSTITTPKPTKDPLNSLILQPGVAIDILCNRDIFTPIVSSVSLAAPDSETVLVTYQSYGTQETHTVELTLSDFLQPFMQLRLQKAQEYECAPEGEGLQVYNRFNPTATYRVERQTRGERVKLSCACEHAVSQAAVFPTASALWQLLGEQVHCKHIVKAALHWEVNLPGFAFIDL